MIYNNFYFVQKKVPYSKFTIENLNYIPNETNNLKYNFDDQIIILFLSELISNKYLFVNFDRVYDFVLNYFNKYEYAPVKIFNSFRNIVNNEYGLNINTSNNIFNDEFWEKQDFVINAVDNIKARKYIDSKCTWYTKPLIDSGTLGTKAHSQMIFPHVTNCYNDKQDPVEDSVPMCTLHNFPSMIEHCIEYGRDAFTGNFADAMSDLQKYLKDGKKWINLRRSIKGSSRKREASITPSL